MGGKVLRKNDTPSASKPSNTALETIWEADDAQSKQHHYMIDIREENKRPHQPRISLDLKQ
jgi:hypothetical protein